MLNRTMQQSQCLLNQNPHILLSMELHERIKRAIKVSGVRGKDVAAACEVTPSSVSQWMAGNIKNLKFKSLFALSDITGFSARWIALGEPPELNSELPGVRLASHEAALLEIYRDLSDRDKEMLFGIIRGMKSVDTSSPPKKAGKTGSRATG